MVPLLIEARVTRGDDLLARARAQPASLRFVEACTLAECFGWVFARQGGSHRIFKRPGSMRLLNLQDVNGMPKPYQVRQLLAAIDDFGDSRQQ